MLHELLLALLGFTGDFVIDERERREALGLSPPHIPEGSPTFCLASDLSFIQPSERSVIEELLPLGFYYRELDHFAASSRNLSSLRWGKVSHLLHEPSNPSKDNPKKPSVYRRAIANGIVEILSLYRSTVLQVEQKLLSDPEPILASVTHGLNKFHLLLPSLHDLVMEIERDDIRGGKLLNLLNKRCHCGFPELQVCLKRLLWHGHQVMYSQLSAWMVYGILQDQHEEFFIRREGSKGGDENLSDALERLTRISDASSVSDWDSGFHIYLDMLPEYIPMQVAEAVLFSGKAVRVLRNPSPSFKSQGAVLHGDLDFSTHVPEITANGLFEEELLPQSEADKIEFMLQELKDASELHKRSFERAIDSVRVIAASHLWQLVVIRADLKGHLKALKDYFLLAKGDFFHCFLEESRRLMRLPPRQATAEADLMVPFQLAAVKTISDEDKYFSRVSLRMSSVGVNTSQLDFSKLKVKMDGSSSISLGIVSSKLPLDGWDGMALEYTVNWPLQFFFTPEVLSKYGKVFQYLIRLKRTQMELEKSWASVMHQGHYEFAKHQKDKHKFTLSQQHHQFSPVWRVREHMAFLIRNLHFYIQVDVIESQWNILLNRVQQSQDFSELVRFHQEYLSALISQSFLDIGSVSRILDCIMKLCLQFCWITESHGCNSNSSDLDQITEEFNKQSNSLYTILRSSRLGGSQRAPFLRRFLMRLNFNSFFESTAKDVINIVRTRPNIKVFE